MPIVPKSIPEKVVFFQQRVAPWTSNAAQINVTAAQMTDMSARVTAAADALIAHNQARQASKDATTVLYTAVAAMDDLGAALIKQIKAQADQTGNDVYALASLPVPATPAPVGPPGTPSDFKVGLQPTGALEFTWKCSNPTGSQGTIYNVYRKPEGATAFEYLGGSGTRKFVDFTLPAGLGQVVYQLQAIRSTSVGVANEFTVKFGVSSSGAMTASVVENTPMQAKIAA